MPVDLGVEDREVLAKLAYDVVAQRGGGGGVFQPRVPSSLNSYAPRVGYFPVDRISFFSKLIPSPGLLS